MAAPITGGNGGLDDPAAFYETQKSGDVSNAQIEIPTGLIDTVIAPTASASETENTSSLDRMERELLNKALKESAGNVSKAARILGISRDTLRYRMEKHHIT